MEQLRAAITDPWQKYAHVFLCACVLVCLCVQLHVRACLFDKFKADTVKVIEVITADIVPLASPLRAVIHATVAWYWACRATSFTEEQLQDLRAKSEALRAAWEAMDSSAFRDAVKRKADHQLTKNPVLLTPKMHRAVCHMEEYVRRWGPMEYLTTETAEALHKPLKEMFRK